jgi:hypothetical protein
MSTIQEEPPNLANDVAVRTYMLICLVALLVMVLAQMQVGADLWALLPVIAGAIGLLMRSSLASLMLLFALGGRIIIYRQLGLGQTFWQRMPGASPLQLTDLLLCAAVLAFVMGHYRLIGLLKNVFPEDPRRAEKMPEGRGLPVGGKGAVRERRSTRLVGSLEWLVLLLSLPIWVVLGQLAWRLLPGRWSPDDIPGWLWAWTGLVVPILLTTGILVVASGFLAYWRRRGLTAEAGQVYLQDVLWEETRREQRRVNRWLAWGRKRRELRLGEGKP